MKFSLALLYTAILFIITIQASPARRGGVKIKAGGIKGPLGGSIGGASIKVGNVKIKAGGIKGPLGGGVGGVSIKKTRG